MKYFPLSYINSKEENEILIDMILSYKKDYLKQFLKEKKLPYSYNKKILKEKLLENINAQKIEINDLVELLDQIEEYGNQHVYLYKNTSEYLNRLSDEQYVNNILEENNLLHVYNDFKPIIIPEETEITSITHDENSFKIKWVEKRVRKIWIKDEIKEDKLIQTWQFQAKRAINTFKVDLLTGKTQLAIQRIPSGSGYDLLRDSYFEMLGEIIDLDTFSPVDLRSAIKKIDSESNVDRRGITFDTIDDGEASFRSRGDTSDYKSCPSLNNARRGLGTRVTGKLGNFYWLPDGTLSRKVHTYIYPNRVGIHGEYAQEELNYVLSKIRSFAE